MFQRKNYFAFSKPVSEFYRIFGLVHVYLKDLDGKFVDCNDLVAYQAGEPLPNLVGKNDYELRWFEIADEVRGNDALVLSQNQSRIFSESRMLSIADNSPIEMISLKTPCQDGSGSVVGMFGISFYLDYFQFSDMFQLLHSGNGKSPQFLDFILTQQKIDGQLLTKQEVLSIYYLSQRLTAKVIARKMNLSYRTVEQYFDQLRIKFKCAKRLDLISKAMENGFPFAELSKHLNI